MKKLILISIFIFFTICSRSWAEDRKDKGLICEGIDNPWHPQVWFFENEFEINNIEFDNTKKKGIYKYATRYYFVDVKSIKWSMVVDADSRFILDRKTLKLELQQWNEAQSKIEYFYLIQSSKD